MSQTVTVTKTTQPQNQRAKALKDQAMQTHCSRGTEQQDQVQHLSTERRDFDGIPTSGKQCFVRFQEAQRTIPVDLAIFAQKMKSLHELLAGLCPTALPPEIARHGLVVCHQGRIIRNDTKQERVRVDENDTITVSLARLKGGSMDNDDDFKRVPSQ